MSGVVYHRRAVIAKRVIWTIMILIGLALLALLYSFKTMAQSARADVRRLEAQIQTEETAIKLLRAEIVYLERPDRVAELADDFLALEPVVYNQDDAAAAIKAIQLRSEAKLPQSAAQASGQVRP
jgi:hypothetical protein